MPTVSALVRRFAERRFPDRDDAGQFLEAWASGQAHRPAVLWTQPRPETTPFEPLPAAPWQPESVDRVPPGLRPGKCDEHEDGRWYSLDLSSVFATVPLTMMSSSPSVVVDVCAAPGGKSLLASMLARPGFLVCNETIGKRTGSLISNLERCRVAPAGVVSLDPAALALAVGCSADLVLVDAPCSGQSLPARGIDNPGCFHERTIQHNSKRQRRILGESARMVAPGGFLLYSTCTYSPEENSDVMAWLIRTMPAFEIVDIPALENHRLPGDAAGYQLWPQDGWGAGAFCCLLRRTEAGSADSFDPRRMPWRWNSP